VTIIRVLSFKTRLSVFLPFQ